MKLRNYSCRSSVDSISIFRALRNNSAGQLLYCSLCTGKGFTDLEALTVHCELDHADSSTRTGNATQILDKELYEAFMKNLANASMIKETVQNN